MSGKEILVDTNIILYLLAGDNTLEKFLQGKDIYISFITELELIGYKNRTVLQEKQIERLLEDCFIIPISLSLKEQYKQVRKKYNLKLADALIAATALCHNLPIITADKHFKVVNNLKLITYAHSGI